MLGSELAKQALESGVTQATKAHVVIGGNRLLVRVTETPLKAQKLTMGVLEDLSPEEALETELKNFQEAQRGLLGQLRSAVAFYGPEQTLEFYNTPFAQLWTLEEGWLNTKPKLGDILEKLREMRRLPEQADFKKLSLVIMPLIGSFLKRQAWTYQSCSKLMIYGKKKL